MIETKDSPEAAAAKAEGWADKKAQWKPMTLVAKSLGGFGLTRDAAAKFGKLVRRGLELAGMSTDEIDRVVKGRMVPWLEILEKYQKAVWDVRNDPKIPKSEKRQLIQDMYAQEDEERVRLFGE